jgi:ribosome-binding factor A
MRSLATRAALALACFLAPSLGAQSHTHDGVPVHRGDKLWFRGQHVISRSEVVEGDVVVASGSLTVRGEVHDPGIGFITLTRVQVSPDLQMARVFYTTLGDSKARRDTARALERAPPFFRRQIGSRLRLRRVPEVEFRFDESIAPPAEITLVSKLTRTMGGLQMFDVSAHVGEKTLARGSLTLAIQ